MANDRATTPAEKATARRLAKALADKIGKRPRRIRRKGHGLALPEPPAARWRRQWIVRLEAVLHKIAVAGGWLHVIWIVSLIGMVLTSVFGSDTVQRQVRDIYFVRTLGLLGAGLAIISIAGLLAFAAWWLKTWRGERLRPALIFATEHVFGLAILAACIGLSAHLEDRLKWPIWLAIAAPWAVMFAIGFPWWRWIYPAIERALLRASHGALRAGVAVLAVTVLVAGGVWAYVYAQ
jgi:hypothetical protein